MRRSDQHPVRKRSSARAEDGVLVRSVLVPGHPRVVVVEPDLPEARVPRQDRRVASPLDEAVERIAHAPRPVLVVAHAQEQAWALEDLRVSLEVLRDGHVEPIPVGLGPSRERPFVREPPRPAAPVREPARARPAPEAHGLPIGLGLHHPAHRLRLDQEALRERALERHMRSARVERRAAPVVVGVPRRGRKDEQDRRGVGGVGPDDEERVGSLFAGGQRHGVVARAPISDRDVKSCRPAAPARRGFLGRRMIFTPDLGGAPHHLALGSFSGDLDVERAPVGRDVQCDGLPSAGRGRYAIGLEGHLVSTR